VSSLPQRKRSLMKALKANDEAENVGPPLRTPKKIKHQFGRRCTGAALGLLQGAKCRHTFCRSGPPWDGGC
jgi:hypothetical protein